MRMEPCRAEGYALEVGVWNEREDERYELAGKRV